MEININEYIDFEKLFSDLYKQNENDLYEYQYEATHYQTLLNFYALYKEKAKLVLEECSLNDNEIVFVYGYEHNDANESDTQSTWESWYITYDTILDEFSSCEYDNG